MNYEKGRPSGTVPLAGQAYDVSWSDAFNVTIKPTDAGSKTGGRELKLRFDIFGQIAEIFDGANKVAITRKTNGLVETVTTNRESRTFAYDGQDRVTSIQVQPLAAASSASAKTGGAPQPYTISLSNYSSFGEPGQVVISGVGTLTRSFSPGGQVSSQTWTPETGSEVNATYNALGQMEHFHDGDSPVQVALDYNPWGLPREVRYQREATADDPPQAEKAEDGEPALIDLGSHTLFGDKNNLTWSLSNGTDVTLDTSGRLIQVAQNGVDLNLSATNFERNPLGQVDAVTRQESEIRVTARDGLRPTQVTASRSAGATSKAGISETFDINYSINGEVDSVLGPGGRNMAALQRDPQSGQLQSYTDPNGVTYQFSYRNQSLSQVTLEGGPTFHYDRDGRDRLLGVRVADMETRFDGYQNEMPTEMTWLYGGQEIQQFTVETTAENRLARISGGGFDLKLTYEAGADATTLPLITEILRQGPGFAEVLSPRYLTNKLDGITITRHTTGNLDDATDDVLIEEDYDVDLAGLPTALRRRVDGVVIIDQSKVAEPATAPVRINHLSESGLGVSPADAASSDYDSEGNLITLRRPGAADAELDYDAFRRIRGYSANGYTAEYGYDLQARRVWEKHAQSGRNLVYAYQGSRVIAIGTTTFDPAASISQAGDILWTHAIGYGVFGATFIKNLDGGGFDYFLFTDHLGTPFAYQNPQTEEVFFTPYSPWGELLATGLGGGANAPPIPTTGPSSGQQPATPHGDTAAVPTTGFTLPADHIFEISPIGLGGHQINHATGLIYMHNRHYAPRLAHFLTPDFRLPSILDPTTFKEPYAYATGNPISYWDPNGLAHEIEIVVVGSANSEPRDPYQDFMEMFFGEQIGQDLWNQLTNPNYYFDSLGSTRVEDIDEKIVQGAIQQTRYLGIYQGEMVLPYEEILFSGFSFDFVESLWPAPEFQSFLPGYTPETIAASLILGWDKDPENPFVVEVMNDQEGSKILGAPNHNGSVIAILPSNKTEIDESHMYDWQYNAIGYIYSNGGVEIVSMYTDTSVPEKYPHIVPGWLQGVNHKHRWRSGGGVNAMRLMIVGDTYGNLQNRIPVIEGINPATNVPYANTINIHHALTRGSNCGSTGGQIVISSGCLLVHPDHYPTFLNAIGGSPSNRKTHAVYKSPLLKEHPSYRMFDSDLLYTEELLDRYNRVNEANIEKIIRIISP